MRKYQQEIAQEHKKIEQETPQRIEKKWENTKITVKKATAKIIPTKYRQVNEIWFYVEYRNEIEIKNTHDIPTFLASWR